LATVFYGRALTKRGIPQIYYGTEVGLEGWKAGDDRDLRRDFPWHVIGGDNHPKQQFRKEQEIYECFLCPVAGVGRLQSDS